MKLNHVIVKLFSQINIGKIIISAEKIELITDNILKIILTLIIMFLAVRIGTYIIKKIVDKQVKSNSILSLDSQRAKTLGEVNKSILKYFVYFTGIMTIISIMFGKISYTFAGIGGVAIGIGAQALIKDVINGFFILFENQFGVGDYVVIGNCEGIVKSIGIRTTVIEGFYGDIHCISNGTITSVTNHSKQDSIFYIDINIDYKEDIDNVIKLLNDIGNRYKKNNEDLHSINVAGVEELSIYGVQIRIIGKSKPLKHWEIYRGLKKEIKNSLQQNNIKMAYMTRKEDYEGMESKNGRKF